MKKLIILPLILFCSCFGQQPIPGPAGADGRPGATVVGPKGDPGTSTVGPVGSPGPRGDPGSRGYSISMFTAPASPLVCANGGSVLTFFEDLKDNNTYTDGDIITNIVTICNGLNGNDGVNTVFSIVSDSGTHCTSGGYDLTLTSATSTQTVYVCNGDRGSSGVAGINGTNGQNGGTITLSLVQVIEPCGAASSPWKEVLLGLQGGQLLSDFSETTSGQNTRLSFIPNGSYLDTDSSGCNFSVYGDGTTYSEITWAAGSNAYSSWPAGGFTWTALTGWVAQ